MIAAQHYVSEHPSATVSSGRGGVGNVRSPSRDPADRARLVQEELREQEMQGEYRRSEANAPHFAPIGRGGLGNLYQEGGTAEHGRGLEASRDRDRDRGRKEGRVGMVRLSPLRRVVRTSPPARWLVRLGFVGWLVGWFGWEPTLAKTNAPDKGTYCKLLTDLLS